MKQKAAVEEIATAENILYGRGKKSKMCTCTPGGSLVFKVLYDSTRHSSMKMKSCEQKPSLF